MNIPRWGTYPHDPKQPAMIGKSDGLFVLYSDHLAYVKAARAEQDEYWNMRVSDLQASEFLVGYDVGYRKGVADERVKARERVLAVPARRYGWLDRGTAAAAAGGEP